jgi:hypothetical protein
MKRFRWCVLGAAVLAAAALGTAYAAGGGGNGGSATPAPRHVSGTGAGLPANGRLWTAVVNVDGTLARGFPQNASGSWIQSTHLATGNYQVQFKQDVSGCAFTASIGIAFAAVAPPGFISVAARFQNAKAVYVLTTDMAGANSDRPFHLQVAC